MNNKKVKDINDIKEKNSDDNLKNDNIVSNINQETYSETSISFSSTKNSFDSKIFEQINNYENYPSIDKFIINENEKDSKESKRDNFILKACNYMINLKGKAVWTNNEFKNLLQNITVLVNKIKNNIKFRVLSINNTRLEIVINYLKNPNIINIKRKVLEIMIFHIFDENSDYFENIDDYSPTLSNLRVLEELIRNKLKNDKNNENIKNDLNKLKKEKEKILNLNMDKGKDINDDLEINNNNNYNDTGVDDNNSNFIIDKNKKRQLNIAKSFLDFYIAKLHPIVHISPNNSNLYLLPRKMFNTEVKESEYLFDLESIMSEEKKDNKTNIENDIVGLEKNKMMNLKIYNEKKILTLNEAIKILFSFDSKLTYLENNAFEELLNRQKEFDNFQKKLKKVFTNINSGKIISKKTTLNFSPEINEQINKYVETFEKEVLLKISKIVEMLLKGNLDECNGIIKKIQAFFENYFNNCELEISDELLEKFINRNNLLHFIKTKILILEKIEELFEDINKKCVAFLEEKEAAFNDLTKGLLSNLRKIKITVEKTNAFENEYELYLKWNQESKYYANECTLEKIKEYLRKFIKGDLNLEMNYTYDSKFCLWAIKKKLGKYFYN